jgi:alpha-D-ribose 1-methylphosphonate 5-phosphate C-P lyase
MKTWIPFLSFLLIITIIFSPLLNVSAQQTEEDFRSENYARAISQIVDQSGGKLDREAVIQQLLISTNTKVKANPSTTLFRGDLMIAPMIDFVGYDGSDSARFSYFTTETLADDLILDFENNLSWVDTLSPVIIDDSIKINVDDNPTYEARLASFTVEAQFAGDTSFVTVWIIQEPLPQKIIYVSPKYFAIPPEGDTTADFIITYFNITGWEEVIPVDWITIFSQTHNGSPDSISFTVGSNPTSNSRETYIKIKETGNSTVSDSIHIYQYGAQEQYLIASPIHNYIDPGGGTINVQVFSNIAWTATTLNPPAGMITGLTPGTDNLLINVAENTTPEPRTAKVKISGGDPLLSDTITIYQNGAQEQYLIASPIQNYIDPGGGEIDVQVFSNVAWTATTLNPPAGMITGLTPGTDNLLINVAENTTPEPRTAKVKISGDDTPLSDTITIYQSAAYLLLSPREKVLPSTAGTFGVDVFRYFVEDFTVVPDTADWYTISKINNDSLSVDVDGNFSDTVCSAVIAVTSATNSSISDTLYFFQYPANQPYIILSPTMQSVAWNQETLPEPFTIVSNNIVGFTVTSTEPSWANPTLSDNEVSVVISVNSSIESRTAKIIVSDASKVNVADTVDLIQGGAPSYIEISPKFQSVSFAGGTSAPFEVEVMNVPLWDVFFESGKPDWITLVDTTGGQIVFTLSEDTTNTTRQSTFRVYDVSTPARYDEAIILQEAAPAPYLFVSPREQAVAHTGNLMVDFVVTRVNVASWAFTDTLTSSEWINFFNVGDSILRLSIDTNFLPETRQASILIHATNDTLVADTVSIYQYSSLDEYLLAAPREQKVFYTDTIINFDVTVVNIDQPWETEILSGNEWIQVLVSGDDSLQLGVSENESLLTRFARIRIFAPAYENVADTITVYQFSAPDPFLLLSPREQWVAHTGNLNLDFQVTAVNVGLWMADVGNNTWITVNPSGQDVLSLNVDENTTLETRAARIYINDSNSDAYDSVMVYQYASLDEYLLASPREQDVFYTDTIINFDVTVVNIEQPWETVILSGSDWIQVLVSGDDSLQLAVSKNELIDSRIAKVRIYAPGNEVVADTVTVYQFAAPDPLLLISPREQWVAHVGNADLVFDVNAVNIETWTADAGNNTWITVNPSGQDILSLNVAENVTLETRAATVYINDDNSDTYDSVMVYQYSSLDQYLLAAPREHEVLFTDTIVNFDITVVNVDDPWETEILSGNDWIQVLVSGDDSLQLGVSENGSLQARIARIRIFAPADENVADTVTVYQFAAPDPYLLISPREQWVVHTGNQSLNFDVTAVNVLTWTADVGNNFWITVNPSGQDVLSLKVDENTTLETRVATVFINDITNPDVRDSVMVYQYSALDSCILASPREQFVPFTGSSISFHVTTVNVNNWVVNTALLPDWIELGSNSEDTLHLNILMNPDLKTRNATVHLYDPNNQETRDSVDVFQFAAVDPYILIAPREKRISHLGNAAVDFDVTLVNVDEWEFVDTTIYQDWIDYRNLGSKMQLSIDTNKLLEARFADIVIRAVGDTLVKDSVSIYQYSGLDQYILMEPREQLAKRYSTDTLYFEIKRVNVDGVAFEIFDDSAMINPDSTYISNDILTVAVKSNNSPYSRQASVKVFDLQSPGQVYDSVSVYQNFPYIILRPSAIDSIVWTDAVHKINTYSNVAQYTVSKSENLEWYQISKDSSDWSNASLTLAGNDQFFMRVDSNNNSYLRRSSFLGFEISDQIATEFWFDQNTRPGKFFPVKGNVFVQNDPQQPLSGVSIVLYDSILKTNTTGIYEYQHVPENWIGTITPLIDTSWAIPYYFLPPRIEIAGLGIIDTTLITPFAAYKIDPTVTLAPKSTAICFGQMLLPGDPGYPTASITDTYGSSTYHWTAIPYDSVMAPDSNKLAPKFSPRVNTTYYLEVYNFFRSTVDSFKIVVNQLPDEFSFNGEYVVCKSQSGVIYQVTDPKPGVYYKWTLDAGNPGGVFANSSFPFTVSGNIAVVNWDENPGNYNLHLVAYNQFDCPAAPLTKIIEITNTEAPPPTTVLRKENDNMLYCSDSLAKYYEWGWLQKNTAGELEQEFIIPGKNDWYCRLPDGHAFNPLAFNYFVIAYYDENSCGSRSFFNAPVAIDEIPDGNISVFPNPGNGIFTIRFGSQVISEDGIIGIYNASGQMIHQQNLVGTRNEVTIDLCRNGSAEPGIYLLVIRTPERLLNYKIVIQ